MTAAKSTYDALTTSAADQAKEPALKKDWEDKQAEVARLETQVQLDTQKEQQAKTAAEDVIVIQKAADASKAQLISKTQMDKDLKVFQDADLKCTNKNLEQQCSKIGLPQNIRSAAVANAEYVIAKFDLIKKGKDKENSAKETATYKEDLDKKEAIRVKYGNDSSTDIT